MDVEQAANVERTILEDDPEIASHSAHTKIKQMFPESFLVRTIKK